MKAAEFVYRVGLAFETIPEHMCQGLDDYIERHYQPGQFLVAVLSNDLQEACGRADHINIKLLHVFVAYLYIEAPGDCWGSPEKVAAWLAARSTCRHDFGDRGVCPKCGAHEDNEIAGPHGKHSAFNDPPD